MMFYVRCATLTHMTTTEFHDQEFIEHVHISALDLSHTKISKKECKHVTFTKVNFSYATFVDCFFESCSFIGCDLTVMKPQYSSFEKTTFVDSRVTGVDWTTTGLSFSASFTKCNLNYSSFMGMSLKNMTIEDCIAKEVAFQEANLQGASFTNTDLTDSFFLRTNLIHTDLSTARGYTINPEDNIIKQTKFSLDAAIAYLQTKGIDVVGF